MGTMHVCQSVRGALKNWRFPEDYEKVFIRDGKPLKAEEARDYLMDCLSEGKEVLPIGDCDNFNFKKGCQGHKDG